MKIKSLLIGMLACTALVGCTDEGLENGTENQKQPELVRGDAYFNFVINTSTDSSRGAVDGTTIGDSHESTDDSKHKLAGSDEEIAVNEILLVVAKTTEESTEEEIELYTSKHGEALEGELDKVRNGYVGYFSGNQLTSPSGSKGYGLASPIRLDYTGKYAVLVVVNPVQSLKDAIKEAGDHVAAYKEILNHANVAYTEKDGTKSFQMSNRESRLITIKKSNTPETAKVASIEVERTVSKTTWRWAAANSSYPGELATKQNVYPIDLFVLNQGPVQGEFWYKKEVEGEKGAYYTYHYSEEFNKASDGTDTYWVLFKKNDEPNTDAYGQIILSEIEAIFKEGFEKDEYLGVVDDEDMDGKDDDSDDETEVGHEISAPLFTMDYASAQANATQDLLNTLTFVYTEEPGDPELADDPYYVHLTHYTLTNQTQSVYTVRHIDDGTDVRQMGALGPNEYLVTPYYDDINKGTAVEFTNSLEDVKTATTEFDASNIPDSFYELPKEGSEGSASTTHTTTDKDGNSITLSDVGGFMQYIFENSCKAEKYTPATITGIVLAGDIYDETGAKVPVLYQYNQKYYRTLQALLNANTELTSKLSPNSPDAEVEEAGIEVYKNGRCFYYTAGIKHFDYSKDVETAERYMEHAIMRNNIYSLGVKSIKGIGDARLTVTENTPIDDIRSYVDLEVTILPWIVRFNDLEL